MIIQTQKHGSLWCWDLEQMTQILTANASLGKNTAEEDARNAMIACCQAGLFSKMVNGKVGDKLVQW
ncbi:MAG TPA: hypothetical protein PLQ36_03420 [Candidatus Gracilibacteria bacterium]|nr:hypothetical protein [Candidatus Gracilibacteria bacterium]